MVAAAYRENSNPGPRGEGRDAIGSRGRLNVLVTDRGQRWAAQLPRLLAPQGVHALRAETCDQALELIEATPIHVAVVDMYLDTGADVRPSAERLPGGLKLLQIIQRFEGRPPAVMVVRSRRFDARIDDFVLAQALKLDAFSVLDQPVDLEQMLVVLRRALERYFNGHWPT